MNPFSDDDLLPISALQHLLFCPRQCALIHLEGLWSENRLTAEGRNLHKNAHESKADSRGALRTARAVQVRSLLLGICGVADVVEFRRDPSSGADAAANSGPSSTVGAHAKPGQPVPFPIEYKRGKPKKGPMDIVQLCAQALCLEEMLQTPVPAGAIFYGKTRRRTEVPFTPELRALTIATIQQLRDLIADGRTPPAVYEKKCQRCSLINQCLPSVTQVGVSARRFVDGALATALASIPEGP